MPTDPSQSGRTREPVEGPKSLRHPDRVVADSSPPATPVSSPRHLSGREVTTEGDTSEPTGADDGRVLGRGAAVGRYVILGKLGAGGMGAIYEAYDPELDRRLAIKLLHPRRRPRGGRRVERDRTRLLREAQAMARLSHPNVITVHDVGTFEDRVFVAMELIDGGTLPEWIEGEKPKWDAILRVLVAAGRGLAAAHSAGLIHRDFKPDNVLVARNGRVVVMDFGLARDDTSDGTSEATPERIDRTGSIPEPTGALSTDLTGAGDVLGTPAYMSPEQHLSQGADARSDQFGFCVAAFEVLHGVRPFAGDTPAAIAMQAAKGDFQAPSGSPVPGWVQRVLDRGLAPRSAERWPSMDALVDALDRDPVARRRRIAWGLAGLLTVGGASAAVILLAQEKAQFCAGAGDRLAGQWDAGRREQMKSAFVATGRGYAESTLATAEAALGAYATAWADMHTEACEATHVHGEQSTELLDRRMACLDRRRAALGTLVSSFTRADEEVLHNAVEMLETLPPLAPCADRERLLANLPSPQNPDTAAEVAAIRDLLDEARTLDAAGKGADGLARAQEADKRALAIGYTPVGAEAKLALGRLLATVGRYDEGEASVREAIVLAEIAHEDAVRGDAWLELAWIVGVQRAKPVDAVKLLALAEGAVRRLGPGQDERMATLAQSKGAILQRLGDTKAAIAAYRESLSLWERWGGGDHRRVANVLTLLGTLLAPRGEFEAAMSAHQRALQIYDAKLGHEHPSRATVIHNMGVLLEEQGNNERALELELEALALRTKSLGSEHPLTASGHNDLGLLYFTMGRYEDAAPHLERSLEIKEKVLGPEHSNVANTLINLGMVHQARGQYDDALADYERALEIKRTLLGPEHAAIGNILQNMGTVYAARDEYELAMDHYQRALLVTENALGRDHPRVSTTLHNIGELHQEQGKLDRAFEYLSRALEIQEARLGRDHPRTAPSLTRIGTIHLERKQPEAAREVLERALEILESVPTHADSLAETQFATARALWEVHEDRTRARRLAEAARDGYTRAGSPSHDELAEVETWLRRHR